jgi:hypothetical protein
MGRAGCSVGFLSFLMMNTVPPRAAEPPPVPPEVDDDGQGMRCFNTTTSLGRSDPMCCQWTPKAGSANDAASTNGAQIRENSKGFLPELAQSKVLIIQGQIGLVRDRSFQARWVEVKTTGYT